MSLGLIRMVWSHLFVGIILCFVSPRDVENIVKALEININGGWKELANARVTGFMGRLSSMKTEIRADQFLSFTYILMYYYHLLTIFLCNRFIKAHNHFWSTLVSETRGVFLFEIIEECLQVRMLLAIALIPFDLYIKATPTGPLRLLSNYPWPILAIRWIFPQRHPNQIRRFVHFTLMATNIVIAKVWPFFQGRKAGGLDSEW